MPNVLIGDNEIDPLYVHLQEQFDSLYEHNEQKFKYIGFKNLVVKGEFMDSLNQIIQKLNEKIGSDYEIQHDIDMTNV